MNSIKACYVWCYIWLFYCWFFLRILNAKFCLFYKVAEMTVFIISWLSHTHCDLIIRKHLIGEKGQPPFFPSFSWKQYNCIFYFIFKCKEESIQAHIDIIFLLRATTVHMFMFAAMTIQHMNRISSMPWRLLKWWFRIINSLLLCP